MEKRASKILATRVSMGNEEACYSTCQTYENKQQRIFNFPNQCPSTQSNTAYACTLYTKAQ